MDIAKKKESLPDKPQALLAGDVLARMGVSIVSGLSSDEVKRRHTAFGPNTIASRRRAKALVLLLHQFQSPVVYLLSAAAALAFYFGELEEGGAIAVVLALNALIGFVTELKAARSIEALRALGSALGARAPRRPCAAACRPRRWCPATSSLLEAGDVVSADVRLVEASNLAADESTLTGESVAVDKAHAPGRRRRAARPTARRCCSRAPR